MHRKDIFQWPVWYQPVSAANKWTLTFTPEDVSDGLPEVCTDFSEVFFNFLGFVGSSVDVSIKDSVRMLKNVKSGMWRGQISLYSLFKAN